MFIPSLRKILSVLVISCLLLPGAFGYCFNLPRLICAEYSQSQLVVIAKLSHKRHFPAKNDQEDDHYVYTLETTETLRGRVGPTLRVYEEINTGRAGFDWNVGESYLLFLNSTDDGMWTLFSCGNSASLKNSKFALRVIRSLRDRRGGLIQGLILDDSGAGTGITIEVSGEKGKYKAVTDSEGKFNIHVPAGRYTVLPVRDGWTFERDFASYEDPANLNIEDGGAAQVQFAGEMNK